MEFLIRRLKQIADFRCEGCLSNTGGCMCASEKDRMLLNLINDLTKDFAVGEKVTVYSRFKPFKAEVIEVKRKKIKVRLEDGRIKWRNKLEVEKG